MNINNFVKTTKTPCTIEPLKMSPLKWKILTSSNCLTHVFWLNMKLKSNTSTFYVIFYKKWISERERERERESEKERERTRHSTFWIIQFNGLHVLCLYESNQIIRYKVFVGQRAFLYIYFISDSIFRYFGVNLKSFWVYKNF